jgi:hypothetical protein
MCGRDVRGARVGERRKKGMMYGGKVQNAPLNAQIPGSPGRSLQIAAVGLG